MSWQLHRIEAITDVVTKGTTPTTAGRQFTDSGVNFIKAEALNGDSGLDSEGFFHIDQDTHEALARSILQEDDVLVTIAGANVGRCGYVKAEHLPANTNQAVGIVRVNKAKAIPRFVYYFFKQPKSFDLCQSLGGQAAQPNVNLTVLKSISLPLPQRPIQEAVVSILSAYDDLIENNRRRMVLLEEAARQLYREWFVRLRFPGHEHTRITSGVPAGWGRKPVERFTTYLNRGIAPHYDDDADGLVINQKCIRDGRLDVSLARHQSREFKPERQVQLGDVLVNSTGEGTLGRVAQVLAPIENCTVDTHVTIVRPANDVAIHYFGQALIECESRLSTMGRGATNQTELSRGQIGGIEILDPPAILVQQFEEFSTPVFRQVWVLMEQNRQLRLARNFLLPRLMSGEITV